MWYYLFTIIGKNSQIHVDWINECRGSQFWNRIPCWESRFFCTLIQWCHVLQALVALWSRYWLAADFTVEEAWQHCVFPIFHWGGPCHCIRCHWCKGKPNHVSSLFQITLQSLSIDFRIKSEPFTMTSTRTCIFWTLSNSPTYLTLLYSSLTTLCLHNFSVHQTWKVFST